MENISKSAPGPCKTNGIVLSMILPYDDYQERSQFKNGPKMVKKMPINQRARRLPVSACTGPIQS